MSGAQLAEGVLSEHLNPDERLLWSGQPRRGVVLRAQDAFLIPFSVFWTGFAVFMTTMTLYAIGNEPLAMIPALFGLVFLSIGLYFLVGRFITDAAGRARTYYGITGDRIIIASGLFARRVKSLQLRTLSDVTLTQRANGSGTITFGPAHPMIKFFPVRGWPGASFYAPPSFDMIEQAKEVYDTVRAAQKASV